MRDIGAEVRLINNLFFWAGLFVSLGIVMAFGGALAWIIMEFWADWPTLSMMLGLWLTALGVILAIITGITQRGLH